MDLISDLLQFLTKTNVIPLDQLEKVKSCLYDLITLPNIALKLIVYKSNDYAMAENVQTTVC
jgi:hypothetical protein